MKKKLSIVLIVFFACSHAWAQKATWIWFPGDYEIWLANQMQNRRTERASFFPPFWKVDSHYPLIDFHKDFNLALPENLSLQVEGQYVIKIDGKMVMGMPAQVTVPAGKHRVNIKVFNQQFVPAIFVQGANTVSDSSWLVTFEDKEWIDESGKASDQSGTAWLNAGYWNFNDATKKPSAFQLPVVKRSAVKTEKNNKSIFADFGRETFGFIKLHGVTGSGKVWIYYGESPEEARSHEYCETFDYLNVATAKAADSVMHLSKAFRYVDVVYDNTIAIDSISMLYEYADVKERGSFRCSDEEINRIYDVAKYTFQLNTREFFIDGIKRDRWIWSGDAYQSYLMNYYLYFDEPTVTRTLMALRGKDPVTSHINTIMDYTFYWFIGIYDYYLYTGDRSFIKQFYPRMVSLMDYCLSRRNKNGMMEGLSGDWIFIDWAEGLSKKGEVSFEQLLLARSLEAMAICAELASDDARKNEYAQLSTNLRTNIFKHYWNEQKQALVHSRVNGVPTENVTRYANMFGIFFNYFTEAQKQGVKKKVLLNDSIQKITTPYMRFYELEALCAMGEQGYVLKEMKNYWGGMLKLGATSFWEEYNPSKKGTEHLAMYGRPFGKSLCHAWGASPVYLLGKYYLGVKPSSPAYATWSAEPVLGGLQWMQGKVPTPGGEIEMKCSGSKIEIKSSTGIGVLRFSSRSAPTSAGSTIKNLGNNKYELQVEKGKWYVVNYKA